MLAKKLKIKKKKLPHSFNSLNIKIHGKNYSPLRLTNYNKYLKQNESNKNFNDIGKRPFINPTYYKDPFFLNETNLNTQLEILRAIEKEKLNLNNGLTIDTNKDTLPSFHDFRSNTMNYFRDPLESDDFYYKSVFKMKPLFRKIRPIVDNKLNMRYAENEDQYKKIIEKEKKILLSLGKKVKNKNISEHINIKMDDIKKRIRFMKGIIDFSYPGFVLAKIKAIDKELKKQNEYKQKLHEYHSPVESRNLKKEIRNNERKDYLFECININNNLK
jgi:hypothetical protein